MKRWTEAASLRLRRCLPDGGVDLLLDLLWIQPRLF